MPQTPVNIDNKYIVNHKVIGMANSLVEIFVCRSMNICTRVVKIMYINCRRYVKLY